MRCGRLFYEDEYILQNPGGCRFAIVTVFVVFDQLCQTFLSKPEYHPKMVPAEVLLVAVVAARYFHLDLDSRCAYTFRAHHAHQARTGQSGLRLEGERLRQVET